MIVEFLPLSDVLPHEQVNPAHVQYILKEVVQAKAINCPLIVARGCHTLLDGHHRYNALRLMKVDHLPCVLVDYDDLSKVEVTAWREDETVCAQIVRRAASTGVLLPPKTSRHLFKFKVAQAPTPLAELFDATRSKPNFIRNHPEGAAQCMMDHA